MGRVRAHLLRAAHAQQHAPLAGEQVLAEGEFCDAAGLEHRTPRVAPRRPQQYRRIRALVLRACMR